MMSTVIFCRMETREIFRNCPGSSKYEDVNGDGLLDDNDLQPLFWTGQPKMHYGITLNASYKGFDFNALLQGSGKYSVRFTEIYSEIMALNGANMPTYFYDRWHRADPYDPNSEWNSGQMARKPKPAVRGRWVVCTKKVRYGEEMLLIYA